MYEGLSAPETKLSSGYITKVNLILLFAYLLLEGTSNKWVIARFLSV